MALLQNGFRDVCGVFRSYGAGASNGAVPQQHHANYALTGMRRNLTAGEGIPNDSVGLPMGYLAGGSYQLPQKPGQLSARAYGVTVEGTASGTMGLPGGGAAALSISPAAAALLPEDDASPLRSAAAVLVIVAEATGELKVSGSGSASISLAVGQAELLGVLNAAGAAEISINTNDPILGAEASATGQATVSLVASAAILPEEDEPPARAASAFIGLTASGIIKAIGHMEGAALPYTELSPQSLAQAVWSYEL